MLHEIYKHNENFEKQVEAAVSDKIANQIISTKLWYDQKFKNIKYVTSDWGLVNFIEYLRSWK